MPPWAPAGPPLLHGSRDNLNWSMCHCNLPIPPCPPTTTTTPTQSLPTATLVFTNTAAHLRGKTLARAPVSSFRPHSEKYILVVNLCVCVCVCVFVRQISQSQVFFPPSRSFKVVNSIFNSKAVNENEILWDRSYTIKSDIKHFFEKCLRLRRLPKTESIVLAGSKLNAQIQCLFCSTSCSH